MLFLCIIHDIGPRPNYDCFRDITQRTFYFVYDNNRNTINVQFVLCWDYSVDMKPFL